jgi:hypothetical protein
MRAGMCAQDGRSAHRLLYLPAVRDASRQQELCQGCLDTALSAWELACHALPTTVFAHLSVVFAALAVTRSIETRTGWSIKKFVRTARRYRTIQIRAGQHTITAEDPLPADLRDALHHIK